MVNNKIDNTSLEISLYYGTLITIDVALPHIAACLRI